MDDNFFDSFHDPVIAGPMAESLISLKTARPLTLMHVCGTHEHSLAKAGIRSMLPKGLRLVAGPGCPVCVCPASDISLAIQAASIPGVTLTTFGDMFRVPSGDTTLELLKAGGADVRVVYSPMDAVSLAIDHPDREVVFMAVGFETTIAPIAAALRNVSVPNFSVITSLRLVPPALKFLLERSEGVLDGFILPGHVSIVLGREGYSFLEDAGIPSVIAGFEPVDMLQGILELVRMIEAGPPFETANLYSRVVTEKGNRKARELIDRVFTLSDSNWRGIGTIPGSGLRLRDEFSRFDAVEKMNLSPDPTAVDVMPGCICHKVILGEAESEDCPLFGTGCTPRMPVGPCMVSSEGTCRARYQYRQV